MPHKRRKKTNHVEPNTNLVKGEMSHRPTDKVLLTYYQQLVKLTDILPTPASRHALDPSLVSLIDSIVVTSTTLVPIHLGDADHSATETWTIADIIGRAQDRLFISYHRDQAKLRLKDRTAFNRSTPNNSICLGYRPADIWRGDKVSPLARAVPLVNNQPNANVKELETSPAWQSLLDLIGPRATVELLSSPRLALFAAMPRGCYRQVAGTVIYDLKPRSQLDKQLTPLDHHPLATRAASVDTAELTAAHPTSTGSPLKRRATTPAFAGLATLDESPHTQLASPIKPGASRPHPETQGGSPAKRRRLSGPSASVPALGNAPATAPSGPAPLAPARVFAKSRSETSLFGGTAISSASAAPSVARAKKRARRGVLVKLSEVQFVRHRMHHAKPSRNGAGQIVYGLSRKNVFTRLGQLFPAPPSDDPAYGSVSGRRTRHLLKYIFPLQFGLGSAFYSPSTTHASFGQPKVANYADREVDIKRLGKIKTPTRLKGETEQLTSKMIGLISKCKVKALLERWCPSKIKHNILDPSQRSAILEVFSQSGTQANVSHSLEYPHPSVAISTHAASQALDSIKKKPEFSEFLCDGWGVEGFVLSVVRETIPRDFWGSRANAQVIEQHVVEFLRLRRYELMSVHTFVQGFALAECDWLRPRSSGDEANKDQVPNAVEMAKRRELLAEFLFWFVDGFLMDLVKTTFQVTEAAGSGSRSLFFRQDDWDTISRPLLDNLGTTLFEKVPQAELGSVLAGRKLGYSSVRLLPKATGVRPIINLGKKPVLIGPKGQTEHGKAINTLLKPAFDVLTFEKSRQVGLVGSLVANPGDIYNKLKRYKSRLLATHLESLPRLYFVKVDVRACFDTINQATLLGILEHVLLEETYAIRRQVELTPNLPNPARRFRRQATAPSLDQLGERPASELHHGVVCDQVVTTTATRDQVLEIVTEHITANLIKIGRDYYRQRTGIAQGSVLSSLLCAIQYGALERAELGFAADDPESLLLRYVDDFLLVTTDREKATRFLRVMNQGMPRYGVEISAEKRMTSFDVSVRPGELVAPCPTAEFPWCGLTISTDTLDVKSQPGVIEEMADRMTVQRHRRPGEGLKRAMAKAVRLRTHVIFLDSAHNAPGTVHGNLYQSFLLLAVKYRTYVREWQADVRARAGWFFGVIRELVELQWGLIQALNARLAADGGGGGCAAEEAAVAWLGYHAFRRVLRRSATQYQAVLRAVGGRLEAARARLGREQVALLGGVVGDEGTAWADARGWGGAKN